MTRRGLLGAVTGLASLVMLIGCGSSGSETFGKTFPPYRYRLTAEVQTPEGVRKGSSVVEVQWTAPGTIMGTQGASSYRIKGEALTIDLPGGQTLFVLLSSPSNVDWAAEALSGAGILTDLKTAKGADRSAHPVPRMRDIGLPEPADNYPYFARFRDIRDPKTVEQVVPDDLAKSFGEGFKLNTLTVQSTDEPVTRGINRRLGWLGPYPEPALNPNHGPDDWSPSATITHGAFIRGFDQ